MNERRHAGFTLLEVLAVVLLTGILLAFTTNFYLDLSAQSRAAVERARTSRRAVVLLDRVARDLESAMLVRKPGPVDPLLHPWLFLAESDDPDLGAQRLKFSSCGHRPRSPQSAESDVEMVAWMLAPGEDGKHLELRRWSSPRLPPGRDLSFPVPEDSDLVARGIAQFGVFLIGEDGERVARWDSSAIADASELPAAAEIEVSLFEDDDSEQVAGPFTRRVSLPLRPLDVEAQLQAAGAAPSGQTVDSNGNGIPDAQEDEDGNGIPDAQDEEAAGGGEENASGITAAECLAANPQLKTLLGSLDPASQAVANSMLGRPMSEIAPLLQGMGVSVPAGCQ